MTIEGNSLIVPIVSARGDREWTYLFFKEYLSLIFFLLIKDVKIFLGTENFLLTNYANC